MRAEWPIRRRWLWEGGKECGLDFDGTHKILIFNWEGI